MVVARCKDLEEQMRIRQKQWDQREVESKTTEKLMRELCEDILAKDSKEMVLGTDYSWSSIQINELIRKSKQSLQIILLHARISCKNLSISWKNADWRLKG